MLYLAFQSGGCQGRRSEPGEEERDRNICQTAVPLPDNRELCTLASSTAGETRSGLSTTLLESLNTRDSSSTANNEPEQKVELQNWTFEVKDFFPSSTGTCHLHTVSFKLTCRM